MAQKVALQPAAKSAEAFRSISEVAETLDIQKHVLRFWESKFPQLKPMKRGGGRRYYRVEDLQLLFGIRQLLHGDGFTIRGVQKLLRDQGVESVKSLGAELMASQPGFETVAKAPETKPSLTAKGDAPSRKGATAKRRRTGPPRSQREVSDLAVEVSALSGPVGPQAAITIDDEAAHAIDVAITELEACRQLLSGGYISDQRTTEDLTRGKTDA
ncbi:MAG: MerR family transcriptional regulator [Pseudomonadota bacterium]